MPDPFSGEPPDADVPAPRLSDPRLSRMRHLSAPIDQGPFRPRPPRGPAGRLVGALVLVAIAVAILAYAFLRASALG